MRSASSAARRSRASLHKPRAIAFNDVNSAGTSIFSVNAPSQQAAGGKYRLLTFTNMVRSGTLAPERIICRAVGGQHRGRRLRIDALQSGVRRGDGGPDLLIVWVGRRLCGVQLALMQCQLYSDRPTAIKARNLEHSCKATACFLQSLSLAVNRQGA